jgi:large subunit ribosomal protein L9
MATKLLLIKDIEELGRSGEVVNVKPGYARNFLLPQGLAVVANARALRMQTRLQEERKQRAILDRQEAESTAGSLVEATVTTIVKVDHEGHMYGSVSAHDIVNLLQEQAGVHLEKRMIVLKNPIKKTGEHKIEIRLKEGVESSINLKIISEEEAANPTAVKEVNAPE